MPKHYKQFTDKENDGLNTAKFMRMFQEKVREMKSNKKSQEYKDMMEEEKIKGGVNVDTDSMMSQGLSSDTARDLLAMDKFSGDSTLEPNSFRENLVNSLMQHKNTESFSMDPRMEFRQTMLDQNNNISYDGPYTSFEERTKKRSLAPFRGNLAQSLMKHKFSNSKAADLSALLGKTYPEEMEQYPYPRIEFSKLALPHVEEKNFMERFSDGIQTDGILPTIGGALEKGGHSFLDLMIGREGGRQDITEKGSPGAMPNFATFKDAADNYLGRKLTDNEYDELGRAIKAESLNNPDSYALVGGTILNRLKSAGIDKTSIEKILRERNQFASVTGTSAIPGEHANFKSKLTDNQSETLESARNLLGYVPPEQKNFTANNLKAYTGAAGTNTSERDRQLNHPQSEVIADSIFTYGKDYLKNKAAGGLISAPSNREETSDEANERLGLLGRVDLQFGDLIRSVFGIPSEEPNNASSAPVYNNNDNKIYTGDSNGEEESIVPKQTEGGSIVPKQTEGGSIVPKQTDEEFVATYFQDMLTPNPFDPSTYTLPKEPEGTLVSEQAGGFFRPSKLIYSPINNSKQKRPVRSTLGAYPSTTLSGINPREQQFNDILNSLSYQQLQEKNREQEFMNQVFFKKY